MFKQIKSFRRRRKLSKDSCNGHNSARSQRSTKSPEFSWDDGDNQKCGSLNRSQGNEEEEEDDGEVADEYFAGAERISDDEQMFGGGQVRGTLSTIAMASSSLRGSPDCYESYESPTARQRNKRELFLLNGLFLRI